MHRIVAPRAHTAIHTQRKTTLLNINMKLLSLSILCGKTSIFSRIIGKDCSGASLSLLEVQVTTLS